MTARVLVVDDISANVRLLEAKLSAEYFDVFTAMNGQDALACAEEHIPDIVLLDVMMPQMDGIEVCKRLKANPKLQHIPVIMITALDQPEDRVRGLEAGADDFLTKPVNDVALFARLRSLVRLKMIIDELRARAATSEKMGFADPARGQSMLDMPGNILLVDDTGQLADRIIPSLQGKHTVSVASDAQTALIEAAEGHYELLIIGLDQREFDGLRLCSQMRSMEKTRQIPILLVIEPEENDRLMRGLDMGVNDYLVRPIDTNELVARVNTQIRRWRYTEQLRASVQRSIELAITDELTGFYNRRYMESHVATLVEAALNRGRVLSIMALDIDHFKPVNDTYGHDVGDMVLRECAERIGRNIRNVDMACRIGGEEFIIILPETNLAAAKKIAERLREQIEATPFAQSEVPDPIRITMSIGVADLQAGDSMESLLKRADQALYTAKRKGRNKVISDAA